MVTEHGWGRIIWVRIFLGCCSRRVVPASFPVVLGDFHVTSPVKLVGKIRTRFQGFSGNSDSANWPGCGKHPSCSSTAKLIYGKTSRKNGQLVLWLCYKRSWIGMLCVLPPTKTNLATLFVARQVRTWLNAQHRYWTPFAAILQNKLHIFVARFTVALKTREHKKNRTEAH